MVAMPSFRGSQPRDRTQIVFGCKNRSTSYRLEKKFVNCKFLSPPSHLTRLSIITTIFPDFFYVFLHGDILFNLQSNEKSYNNIVIQYFIFLVYKAHPYTLSH